MSEIAEKPTIIKLDTNQLRDLIITFDYLTKELKNIGDKLNAIESELKLLRIEIKDKKGDFD
jgi:hypothetical protein